MLAIIGRCVDFVLMAIGLAGVPGDWATWAGWWETNMSWSNWSLVILALILTLLTIFPYAPERIWVAIKEKTGRRGDRMIPDHIEMLREKYKNATLDELAKLLSDKTITYEDFEHLRSIGYENSRQKNGTPEGSIGMFSAGNDGMRIDSLKIRGVKTPLIHTNSPRSSFGAVELSGVDEDENDEEGN